MNFKAEMHYKDGKLIPVEYPKTSDPQILIPMASIIGGVEMLITNFVMPGVINGVIYIDATTTPIKFTYDLTPVEAIPAVRKAIALFHKSEEDPDKK